MCSPSTWASWRIASALCRPRTTGTGVGRVLGVFRVLDEREMLSLFNPTGFLLPLWNSAISKESFVGVVCALVHASTSTNECGKLRQKSHKGRTFLGFQLPSFLRLALSVPTGVTAPDYWADIENFFRFSPMAHFHGRLRRNACPKSQFSFPLLIVASGCNAST